jgi:virginiamycin B lyase
VSITLGNGFSSQGWGTARIYSSNSSFLQKYNLISLHLRTISGFPVANGCWRNESLPHTKKHFLMVVLSLFHSSLFSPLFSCIAQCSYIDECSKKEPIMSFPTTPISTTMTQVSCGSQTNIWGVDAANNIYQYTGVGTNWTHIPGVLKQISVAADGTVWGVNPANTIYKYAGNNAWTQISGVLGQVSVGSASLIWGVNPSGTIYQYNGSGWTQIAVPGVMKQVSVASDGSVWGVNPNGLIYQYAGNNTWTQMPGHTTDDSDAQDGLFTQVTAATATYIRALDPAGQLYTYYGSGYWSMEGVVDPGVKGIALASDLTFVFIDSTGTTQLLPYDPTPPTF